MSSTNRKEFIVATEEARTLPANELLTGRGFITGKSGSGKSNTMSVVAEELLDGGYNLLIVDTDGEYFGLKEKYQLLHAGATDRCDIKVTAEHAERIAELALKQNLPVILDVSGYNDVDEAKNLIYGVVNELFVLENNLRKPFLLIVEEMQEYLPQSGGSDDLSKLLLRVAKRGRKRGLGLCGLSQRPSAVDKDFITQCDWLVWHRLTWETDLGVVESILGSDIANEIPELRDGEAYLMTDWDESIERVQFRQKTTFDAGATPGLEGYDRPDITSLNDETASELLDSDEEIPLADTTETTGQTAQGDSSEPMVNADTGTEESSPPESTDPQTEFEDELNLVVNQVERSNPETTDPSELQARLQEERKRNEILEAEIKELKTIIDTLDRPARPTQDNDTETSSAQTDVFSEQHVDGPANILVEAGLLVTYLLFKLGNNLRRGIATIQRHVGLAPTPTQSSSHAYPITLDGPESRRRELTKKYVIPATILLLLLGFTSLILFVV